MALSSLCGRFGTASWLAVINATGATLAAIPVALAVLLWGGSQRKEIASLAGVLAGVLVVGGGLVEFGLPTYAVAWVVDLIQLVSICVLVPLLVLLLSRRPLTTRWSGP